MILGESGKCRLITEEKQRLDIIKQIKPLVDEGIQILLDDGILPYHEIDALAFRIKEFLTRKSVSITRKLEIQYLGLKICTPIKRPRRPQQLNIQWYDMVHAYYSIEEDPHH